MIRLARAAQSLRGSIGGSLPLQYAIVVSSTALIAVLIMQTAGYKVAAKLNAVTSTLSKL
jgi:hypothetical protein